MAALVQVLLQGSIEQVLIVFDHISQLLKVVDPVVERVGRAGGKAGLEPIDNLTSGSASIAHYETRSRTYRVNLAERSVYVRA